MFVIFAFFVNSIYAGELIKKDNGYFITGRGCGTNTPLKYMNYIPEDLDEYECSFINLKVDISPPLKNNIKRMYRYRLQSKINYYISYPAKLPIHML